MERMYSHDGEVFTVTDEPPGRRPTVAHLAGCPECDSSLGRNPEVRDGTGFRLTLADQES